MSQAIQNQDFTSRTTATMVASPAGASDAAKRAPARQVSELFHALCAVSAHLLHSLCQCYWLLAMAVTVSDLIAGLCWL